MTSLSLQTSISWSYSVFSIEYSLLGLLITIQEINEALWRIGVMSDIPQIRRLSPLFWRKALCLPLLCRLFLISSIQRFLASRLMFRLDSLELFINSVLSCLLSL